MTTEQREKLLKRALPALGILVIYFVIISHFVTDKYQKVHDQFVTLSQKGLTPEVLRGIQKEQQQVAATLTELQQQEAELTKSLESLSGVVLIQGKSANESVDKVSVILAANNLEVLEEKRSEKQITKEQLPRSLRDADKWLKEMLAPAPKDEPKGKNAKPPPKAVKAKPEEINVWTIHYTGSYLDSYHALIALADSDIKVLPLSLTMQPQKTTAANTHANKQEWILTLWL